ncbi:hypothetical protein J0910_00965 [Nocardiopsis sp. CNT-189]|uniref:hypothetical protein n=1 Tax=Nocardiopsis oceanisediminis TaxID=2816862 RepID=UPI003B395484
MRGRIILPILIALWLLIGVAAAFQRGYLSTSEANCATVGSTLITIAAGPLNYFGVNPTVECPELEVPQPSE